ncbi:putative F-box/FBD/LRR-repeat protein [Prunus yedoensis var. nudiflora]|uniref:Putative F-box/FBD/LRR-repeat protein n=1 Tax=Prunus yedoensis var. nudiflora TaxID=2094558 RepID=A0A314ZTD0_PRUYE|nr:putative F-box/FBD/LRR-repeat protein [Prunus yedoensis var. nudiflora]
MATNKKHKPYLADDIIYQILRRLPTKSAVRMNSLSKQWEGVWSPLPSLDFYETIMITKTTSLTPKTYFEIKGSSTTSWQSIWNIVKKNNKEKDVL